MRHRRTQGPPRQHHSMETIPTQPAERTRRDVLLILHIVSHAWCLLYKRSIGRVTSAPRCVAWPPGQNARMASPHIYPPPPRMMSCLHIKARNMRRKESVYWYSNCPEQHPPPLPQRICILLFLISKLVTTFFEMTLSKSR